MPTYYPLAVGNTWTYKMKDGKAFTNTVVEAEDGAFVMNSTMIPRPQRVRREGSAFLADNFEPGNFQVFLRDDLEEGDEWKIEYTASQIHNILEMVVKETGGSIEVEGNTYTDVIKLEGELKMAMQGAIASTNYFVQYYYARGVGLILTTTSYGDSMALMAYELK